MAAPITLQRSIFNRIYGGALFQGLLLLLWVLALVALVSTGHRTASGLVVVSGIFVVALAVWSFGVTAWARADENGISWRYYLPHTVAWSDVRAIEKVSKGMSINSVRVGMVVRTTTGTRRITPADGLGDNQRAFLAQLQAMAAGRAGRG